MSEQEAPRTLADAQEYIKHQEPLVTTYETSDFKQGLNRGAWLEQERIIKLLKNPSCKPNDHDYSGGCNCDVIALIEGEK